MKAGRTDVFDEDEIPDDHRQQSVVRSLRWKMGQHSNAVYAFGPSKLVIGLLAL